MNQRKRFRRLKENEMQNLVTNGIKICRTYFDTFSQATKEYMND